MGFLKEALSGTGNFLISLAGDSTKEIIQNQDQTNEKKPLMDGGIFGAPTGMVTDLDKNAYEIFYAIYNNTPELYGLFSRIRGDVLADGYTILTDRTEQEDEIKDYLFQINFDEKMESTINDLLITGDGFQLVSELTEEAILECVQWVLEEANSSKLNPRRIVEQVNTPYKLNLFPIKSSTVEGKFDESGYPLQWVQEVAGKKRWYDGESVIHYRMNPVSNDPWGNTPLFSLRNVVIAALIFLRDRQLKYFQQGGTPNHVFKVKAPYGSDSYNRIANILQEFNKPGNQHKNILLAEQDGIDIEKLKEKQDMDFVQLWDKLVETIFVAWGMPPTVAGLLGNSKVGESSFAHEAYYKNIDVLQRKLESQLNRNFFSKFGKGVKIEFNRAYKKDEVREVDIKLKTTMYLQTQIQLGLITREAAARELDIPEEDVPKEADLQKGNLAQDLQKLQQMQGENGIDPMGAAAILSPQGEEPQNKASRENESAPAPGGTCTHPQSETISEQDGGLLYQKKKLTNFGEGKFKSAENRFVRDLNDYYTELEKTIVRVVEANARESGKPKVQEALADKYNKAMRDIEQVIKSSEKRLKKLSDDNVEFSYDLGVESATRELDQVSGVNKIVLSLESKNRFDVLKVSTFALVQGTNESMKKKLQGELQRGIMEREGIPDLRKRVKNVMGNTKYEAERIARTETNRSLNESHMATYRDSGVVEKLQWITFLDDRTADNDRNANGSIRKVGESFPYVGVSQPPAHPNCRCRVVAYFDEPGKLK